MGGGSMRGRRDGHCSGMHENERYLTDESGVGEP